MFRCTLVYVHSSIAIDLMGKRELIALLDLSSWCLVMVERLFLAVPGGCLQFVIVVFPDHTHLLFFLSKSYFFKIQIEKFNSSIWIFNHYKQAGFISKKTNVGSIICYNVVNKK